MTPATPAPEELAAIARSVAVEAGQLLLAAWRTRPQTTEKASNDLVTAHDLASEHLILARLREATPGLPIVGEETGGHAQHAEPTWYCDPLDGTTNFVHGHPCWAVSLGILHQGVPLAGAVAAPALGVAWHGSTPGGAYRAGTACQVSATLQLGDALVATGFPPDRRSSPANNIDTFARVLPAVRGARRCGSAAIDCCLVADGTYDAYWERRLHPWDLAGGCAVALAAGATLTALDGSPPDLTIGNICLSNGHLHPQLLPLIGPS